MTRLTFDAFWANLENRDEALFLGPGRDVDGAAFRRACLAVAGEVRARGWRAVGIHALDSWAFAAGVFGVVVAGAMPEVLPHTQPGFVGRLAGEVDGLAADHPLPADCGVPSIAIAPAAQRESSSPDWRWPSTPSIAFWTSGSSGAPKRVAKSLAAIEAELTALETRFAPQLPDTVGGTVDHQHYYGATVRILWPLLAGRRVLRKLMRHPSDVMSAGPGSAAVVTSPTFLVEAIDLLRLDELRSRNFRLFSAGAPLPAGIAERLNAGGSWLVAEIFGSTESGAICSRIRYAGDGGDSSAGDGEVMARRGDDACAGGRSFAAGRGDDACAGGDSFAAGRGDDTCAGGRSFAAGHGDDAWTILPGVDVSIDDRHLLIDWHTPQDGAVALSDRGELLPDGRLRFFGRRDRIVKVREKRVSLAALEAELSGHPFVREVAAVVLERHRLTELGVVVAPTEAGFAALEADGHRALAGLLQKRLRISFDPTTVPKKWRFVRGLPRNGMAKVTQESLAELFAGGTSGPPDALPEVVADSADGLTRTVDLRIGGQLRWFRGHFPNIPVLPGVVQIDWAAHFGAPLTRDAGRFERLQRVKFNHAMQPGVDVRLALRYDADKRSLSFTFSNGERTFSEGRFVYA